MLMTIDVTNYLKDLLSEFLPENAFFCDVLDIRKEKALAVYRSPNKNKIGRNKCDVVTNSNFSIRLRGGTGSVDAELLAKNIYEKIEKITPGTIIGNKKISCVIVVSGEPERIGRDEKGVVEYLIEIEIYYFK